MLMQKSGFALNASNFDLTDAWNILRVVAGAFFVPHAVDKFAGGALNPAVIGFFEAAGLPHASYWVILAALSEIIVGIALVLGICTRFAATGGALILTFAVYALQMVAGFSGWFWNTGGYEYPVFWGIVCIVIAIEEFRRSHQAGRPKPVSPTATA